MLKAAGALVVRSILAGCLLLASVGSVYAQKTEPYVIVLGTAQDGGYPHAGCKRKCCEAAWKDPELRNYVVSLALVDPGTKRWWLLEATPDIKYQLQLFRELTDSQYEYLPGGIFITHAHIGHYTGLMQLGKEVMNSKEVPVFVLPKMADYLESNGPWSQLIALRNISIHSLFPDAAQLLNDRILVETFTVPHRDEYSETAGFRIRAGARSYLFIPDIDKWSKWEENIISQVKNVDVAFIDATFSDGDELPGRKISEVPHPLVSETMDLFKDQGKAVTNKIYFIHFNHTNPLLWDKDAKKRVKQSGFNVAVQGSEL